MRIYAAPLLKGCFFLQQKLFTYGNFFYKETAFEKAKYFFRIIEITAVYTIKLTHFMLNKKQLFEMAWKLSEVEQYPDSK